MTGFSQAGRRQSSRAAKASRHLGIVRHWYDTILSDEDHELLTAVDDLLRALDSASVARPHARRPWPEIIAERRQRLATDPSLAPHGSTSTYTNWGCRCAECRAANANYQRDADLRRAISLDPDDPRHGQASTYHNYKCRCGLCREAERTARKARTG